MVDIYKAQRGEIRNESHFTLPGDIEFVLASDYAALEAELKDVRLAVVRLKMGFDHIQAERDEWKRRCETMAKLSNEWHESNGCVDHWERSKGYLARIVAIAEGRDK